MTVLKFKTNQKTICEQGFSLLEVIVATGLFSVIALGIVKSSVLANSTINRSINNTEAMRIAQETLEQYYLLDPEDLSAADSFSDTVNVGNYSFSRNVTISVNPDRTRVINADVEGENEKSGGKASATISIALRGTR